MKVWELLGVLTALLVSFVLLSGQDSCEGSPCTGQPAGIVCDLDGDPGAGVCDGAGACAECVVDADCSAGVCDGAGACAECVVDADCTPSSIDCPPVACVDKVCLAGSTPPSQFCDLYSIDDGLCDRAGMCIAGDGSLGIVGYWVDTSNYLRVYLRNASSTQTVPANKGNLRVFVDGELVEDLDLGTLADQSFRQPRSFQQVTLDGVRIGNGRRLGIVLDTENELAQKDEDRNSLTSTVASAPTGPDLVISDLWLTSVDTLYLTIRNDGNSGSYSSDVAVDISINGTAQPTVTMGLPSLGVGTAIHVAPSYPAITISAGSVVVVKLSTADPTVDIDTFINQRWEVLPDGSVLPIPAYDALLNDPKIADNLKWEDTSGVVLSFPSWTSEQTTELWDALRALELGEPAYPPYPGWLFMMDEATAFSIYIRNVAHSLWVEHNQLVEWSLLDLPDEQLAFILDGRNWFGIGPEPPDAYNVGQGVGAAVPWNPSAAYEFLDGLSLIKSDPLSTLEAVIEWGTVYTRHVGSGDAPAWVGASSTSGAQPVSSISYPLEGFDHIVNGCQGGTAFYVSILRIINIPTKAEWMLLGSNNHMRPSFPSVDLSMPHADNVFHPYFGNGRADFGPVSDIFYTGAEMDTLFLNPALDCNGSDCNTVGEQASHNSATSERLRCADTLCDKLMSDYIDFGPDHVRNVTLAIPGGRTPASDFAFPLFTTAEQDAIIADIEAYLTLLGSGDIELGKTEYDLRGAHPN